MVTDVAARPDRLRDVRGLGAYAAAAGLARLADEMVAVAVVLLVLQRTASPALAGATVAAYTLPSVLTGPLSGALLDRTRYRRATLAGNGIVLAAVAFTLLVAVGRAPDVLVLLLAALAGVALPMTSGGYSSLVPLLVPKPLLAKASALDATVFGVAAVLAPAVAGLLSAVFGPAHAVAGLGVAALAGAACTGLLPQARGVPPPAGSLAGTVRAGVLHLLRTRALLGGTVTTVVGFGAVGMFTVALPALAARLGAGPAAAGYLWAALELGALLATVAVSGQLHRWRPERVVFCCTTAFGVLLLCWPLAGGFTALLVLAGVAGLAQGPTLASIIAARQRYTTQSLLAQVATTGASMKIGGFALGSLLGGLLVPAFGTSVVVAVVAAAQLVSAAAGWLIARTGGQ